MIFDLYGIHMDPDVWENPLVCLENNNNIFVVIIIISLNEGV